LIHFLKELSNNLILKAMKKKIMIADDNEVIRMLLEEYLKSDFFVDTFEDGVEILNSLNEGNIPDLIIADIRMPTI